ncbi:ABC transporter ATP-binding protein [soil metagenome]
MTNAVEFINISKQFHGCVANEDVSFSIQKNTVHCLLGENGAGKSTLMKILFGEYQPTSGSLKINGQPVKFTTPLEAISHGIGMVHQHFMLIDDFTVWENVALGYEKTSGLKLDKSRIISELNKIISKYNLDIDPEKKVSEISISAQQKTEILKLLYRNSDILIFDEPTAVLSPVEVNEFYKIIRRFIEENKTVILITHKLNEVLEIANRVSILRKGKLVFETTREELDKDILSREIVGDINIEPIGEKNVKGENKNSYIEFENISYKINGVKVLNNISFKVNKGEIVGICGVEGNGQTEIVDIISRILYPSSGRLMLKDKYVSLVPDDRIKKGMISQYSTAENVLLKREDKKIISKKFLNALGQDIIRRYDVRLSSACAPLSSLSGGNQQKVIFARELESHKNIMVFHQPTRGVDINAAAYIHRKIVEQRNKGKAILLISSDLDELFKLADRLLVIYKGSIVMEISGSEFQDPEEHPELLENIGKAMIGV